MPAYILTRKRERKSMDVGCWGSMWGLGGRNQIIWKKSILKFKSVYKVTLHAFKKNKQQAGQWWHMQVILSSRPAKVTQGLILKHQKSSRSWRWLSNWTFAALSKNWGLVFITHMVAYNYNSNLIWYGLLSSMGTRQTDTHTNSGFARMCAKHSYTLN